MNDYEVMIVVGVLLTFAAVLSALISIQSLIRCRRCALFRESCHRRGGSGSRRHSHSRKNQTPSDYGARDKTDGDVIGNAGDNRHDIVIPPPPITDTRIRLGLDKFIREKGYLDPDISLGSLCIRLKTNRSYLNDALQDIYNVTYIEFINGLRISHAMDMIKSSKGSLILKSVAFDCGYRSIETFYRNFIKHVGCSPVDWKNRMLLEEVSSPIPLNQDNE